MATWNELAMRLVPNIDEEFAGFLLWNHTPFPFVSVLKVARHLRRWYRRFRAGWSECCFCGKPYRHWLGKVVSGGTCQMVEEGTWGCFVMDEISSRRDDG